MHTFLSCHIHQIKIFFISDSVKYLEIYVCLAQLVVIKMQFVTFIFFMCNSFKWFKFVEVVFGLATENFWYFY